MSYARVVLYSILSLSLGFFIWLIIVLQGDEKVFSGSFGDAFSPFTALGTGVASILALWSIRQQYIELRATREETKEQKEEFILEQNTIGLEIGIKSLQLKFIDYSNNFDIVFNRKTLGSTAQDHKKYRISQSVTMLNDLGKWSQSFLEIMDGFEKLDVSSPDSSLRKSMDNDSFFKAFTSKKSVIVMSISFLLFFIGWGILILKYSDKDHYIGSGFFGDSFGPLVGIFTALTLLLSLISIMIQQEELSLTRKELMGQKEALAGQNYLRVINNRIEIQKQLREYLTIIMDFPLHARQVYLEDPVKEAWELSMNMVNEAYRKNRAALSELTKKSS